ncbi:MAG TPA: DUF1223 domain-containing protein, partial [Candidatus Binatia bacterium]|nr:DUF1223 domain-containing protein [Candidatus Binatia bacterium]
MFPSRAARSAFPALFFAATFPLIFPLTHARAADKPPAAAVPIVIELFTSEGCSSCPPADLFVQKLDTYQPIQGAQLIVLSEHVTYWDQQGWKDPNSSAALTERQSSYEGELGQKEVFTPQMIINGNQQVSLENPQHIQDVLEKERTDPRIPVRITTVAVDPQNPSLVRAHVETDVNSGKHNADVYVALALDHVESQVLRGENGGKHLVHVGVVQQLTKVGKLSKGKSFSDDVQVKLKPGEDPKNLRLVAFVQESGPGKLLGAAKLDPLTNRSFDHEPEGTIHD